MILDILLEALDFPPEIVYKEGRFSQLETKILTGVTWFRRRLEAKVACRGLSVGLVKNGCQ